MEEPICGHEIYRIAKRLRQSTLQFAPPYEFEGVTMVLVPKAWWKKLCKALEEYEEHWFGEKTQDRSK